MNPIAQILSAFTYIKIAPDFIKKHRLWEGYWSSGWIAKSTIMLAAVITIFFIMDISSGIQELTSPLPEQNEANLGTLVDKIYFDGGIKYLILIILEMLIFHFSVKTLDVVSGTTTHTTPKDFIDAQFRMIKVSFRNYIQEIIIGTAFGIILGIFGLSWLKGSVLMVVQFYFIGFAFMDNYYEQGNLKIKESAKYIREHMYAAIIIGGVGYILFMIPLLGAILGPFVCAVAATLYLYNVSDIDAEILASTGEGELAL